MCFGILLFDLIKTVYLLLLERLALLTVKRTKVAISVMRCCS